MTPTLPLIHLLVTLACTAPGACTWSEGVAYPSHRACLQAALPMARDRKIVRCESGPEESDGPDLAAPSTRFVSF
jgi:hypothetical protein